MNEEIKKVLVVEDESSIRKFITINLNRNGFEVLEAENGEIALEMLKNCAAEIVILDVMLPGIDGFEVCQRIREINSDIVIIMLTARGQDMDKIMGLELGADDYMVKPFNPLELIARIRTVLRRSGKNNGESAGIIDFKTLQIDLKSQKFFKNSVEIELTPREFSIITTFMKNPGKAFSRDELLDSVWGKNYFGDIKTVDVHIRRLREKIEDDPSEPQYIKTIWGYGYIWQ